MWQKWHFWSCPGSKTCSYISDSFTYLFYETISFSHISIHCQDEQLHFSCSSGPHISECCGTLLWLFREISWKTSVPIHIKTTLLLKLQRKPCIPVLVQVLKKRWGEGKHIPAMQLKTSICRWQDPLSIARRHLDAFQSSLMSSGQLKRVLKGSSRHVIANNVLVCVFAVRGAERPSVCKLGWQRPHFVWMRVSSSYTYTTKPQQPGLIVFVVQEEEQFTSCMIRSELPNNCWKQAHNVKNAVGSVYCIICSSCSMLNVFFVLPLKLEKIIKVNKVFIFHVLSK